MKAMKKRIDPFRVKRKKTAKKPVRVNSKKKLLEKAVEILLKIEDMKSSYKELDEILDMLIKREFSEGVVGKRRVILKDRFAVKNTAWKSTPMRRFELELG